MKYSLTHTLAALLALGTLVTAGPLHAACEQRQGSSGGSEILGTLLGAAVGGLIGSQIGGGTGKKVAIGAGVLAGGLLGNRLGASLDCNDQRYHQETTQSALETKSAGSTSTWSNPDSGHAGTVTPTRTYQRVDGTYCRDYEQTIEVNGQVELATGTACRDPDGSWRVVNT